MPRFYRFNKKTNFFSKTYAKLNFIPKSKLKIINSVFFVWEYDYTSTSLLDYTICLNYERGWTPRVWVVKPDLTKGYIPHAYKQNNNSLCLFHSRDFTWSVDKDIVQTIICWSCLWIEYYEIYKVLGKWVGPEAEHDNTEKIIQESNNLIIDTIKIEEHPKYLKNYPIRI